MADRHSLQGHEDASQGRQLQRIPKDSKSIKGPITRYILNTRDLTGHKLRRMTFGEKENGKPHKTILMVGETGSGKSTLINAMVNYMLGVPSTDRVWCELIETKETQTKCQTNAVTVYDVFVDQSPFSLTAIDTPGYGNTEDTDLRIAESLLELCISKYGVHEINVVCLVVSSHTTRLTDRQLYVFDAILSLFGKDVERNIILLFTHACNKPINSIKAVKKSKVRCAKTEKGEPVYFIFNNSHCESFNEKCEEENEEIIEEYTDVWDLLTTSMNNFFAFLNESKTVSLSMTEIVLKKRKELTDCITSLKDRITLLDLTTKQLEQTRAALEQHEKEKSDMNNFEYEVDEPYKEKVPIKSVWWRLTKKATSCSVCEENCHYPGCWWVRDVSRCSVMKAGKYTVCSGRCDYTQHVKEAKVYKLDTRKVKRSSEELKRKFETESNNQKNLIIRLENEVQERVTENSKLVAQCYECIVVLKETALDSHSLSMLQHLSFLTDRVKDMSGTEVIRILVALRQTAEAEAQSLEE